jgi:site-specific recombinase XerD
MQLEYLNQALFDGWSRKDRNLLVGYTRYLAERGYGYRTQRGYVSVVAHWLRWRSMLLQTSNLDRHDVRQFLDGHLPRCQCPDSGDKTHKMARAALNQLLIMHGYARIRSAYSQPTSSAIESWIIPFDDHLKTLRGLAAVTRRKHCRCIRHFLWWYCGTCAIDVETIDAPDLIAFITIESRRLQPSSVRCVVTSLRIFLRFLRFRGYETVTLAGNLAAPRHYRLAGLPHSLDAQSLERFWASFNCSTASGRRDYAMARCLADLGLRCVEVADLTLAAFDWRTGNVRLSSPKNRHQAIMPLPASTANAVAAYLCNSRPVTTSRAVFVHHRAPMGHAVRATTVRNAIRRAFARAGLPFTGTHVLRRTLATRLLDCGTPLNEIADVLRHSSIDTTRIYTKVDQAHLRQVALPWVGGHHE